MRPGALVSTSNGCTFSMQREQSFELALMFGGSSGESGQRLQSRWDAVAASHYDEWAGPSQWLCGPKQPDPLHNVNHLSLPSGTLALSHLEINSSNLCGTWKTMGSQCRFFNTGVIRSLQFALIASMFQQFAPITASELSSRADT